MSTGHLHLDGFSPGHGIKIQEWLCHSCIFGAGDRTRTGTLSPAVDFESTTSTIPSHRQNSFLLTFSGRLTGCGARYLPRLSKAFVSYRPWCSAQRIGNSHACQWQAYNSCPSLRSLIPPQAALPSLPITPAGAKIVYTIFFKIASIKNKKTCRSRSFLVL